MEITFDINLLQQDLNLNNLKYNKALLSQNVIYLQSILDVINEITNLVKTPSNHDYLSPVTKISSIEEYLIFLTRDYIEKLRDSFSLNEEKITYITIVVLTAYISRFSNDYFQFYRFALNDILHLNHYFKDTQQFVESRDIRGLIFSTYKNYLSLDWYDLQFNCKSNKYNYTCPKINKEWIINYRKKNQPINFWFYQSNSNIGLFIVFYSLKCRYRQCIGCCLHQLSSETKVSDQELCHQIDYVVKESISSRERLSTNEVVLSNNGSMLDRATMPEASLSYIIDRCLENFAELKKIIIESRLDYINDITLLTLTNGIKSKNKEITIELAIGIEIFDDYLRNEYYKKGVNLSAFEEKLELFEKYNISVRIYMMFRPYSKVTLEESVNDVNNASKYFSELAKSRNIKFILHIIPTFVSNGSTLEMFSIQGKYAPPSLYEIELLLDQLEVFDEVDYYISLNDEGLSSGDLEEDFYKFIEIKNKIDKFNLRKDWKIVERL